MQMAATTFGLLRRVGNRRRVPRPDIPSTWHLFDATGQVTSDHRGGATHVSVIALTWRVMYGDGVMFDV